MESQDISEEYVDFMHALGKRIKQLRIELGLSLRDMVVLHGYHDSQWRRMEREGAGLQSLLRISKAFGLSLSVILDNLGQLPGSEIVQSQAAKQTRRTTKKTTAKKKTK